jgi:hypothetical protein
MLRTKKQASLIMKQFPWILKSIESSSHVLTQEFCFEQKGLSSYLEATTTMDDVASGPFLRITKTDHCPAHGDG